jgi:hypothetical protein
VPFDKIIYDDELKADATGRKCTKCREGRNLWGKSVARAEKMRRLRRLIFKISDSIKMDFGEIELSDID